MSDVSDEAVSADDTGGRPLREKRLTMKALENEIRLKTKDLRAEWRRNERALEKLQQVSEDDSALSTDINYARYALESYSEAWADLQNVYAQDKTDTLKADILKANNAFLENRNFANEVITQALNRACSSTFEVRSTVSRRSAQSGKSRRSSSSVLSARAQALADAAAADQEAAFEEAIAKRIANQKAEEAAEAAVRAKTEAEHLTKQAMAESELRILQARKTAAVERARANAIVQAELEETPAMTLTSPEESANDHAARFCAKTVEEDRPISPTQLSTAALRPLAPAFEPIALACQPSPVVHTESPVAAPIEATLIPQKCVNPETPPEIQSPLLSLTREISDTLARQRQPTHEPDVYEGDPIMFQPWRSAFETMVNHANTPATQKLTFLAKYTKGEVKKLVDRFRHRYVSSPETAYEEAWRELEERFGNKTNITAAVIRKLNNFPKIKPEESRKLQELADLCSDAAAQMHDLPELNVLNFVHNLHPILEKLPGFVHNSWRKVVTQHKADGKTYPPFRVFTKFLKDEARMLNDPDLYPMVREVRNQNIAMSLSQRRPPVRVMATKGEPQHPAPQKCIFHQRSGHSIAECIAFSRKPIKDRHQFCKEKGLCFKCGDNHLIKECQNRVECSRCRSSNHALFMHPPKLNGGEPHTEKPKKETEGKPESNSSVPETPNTTTNTITKCTRSTTCTSARSCSKIVLCKIYHLERPSRSILGYAVLDDQSNACLGDPEIFEALGISGATFPYELSTCGGEKIAKEGRRANGLVVESETGRTEPLPTVIENAYIPGDRSEIPSPDLCEKFPHLRTLASSIPKPRDDVNIILLIGRNCPELLKVRESRNGPRGMPWAQRTNLGWTISGQVCMSGAKGKVHASVSRTVIFRRSEADLLDNQPFPDGRCDNHIEVKEVFAPRSVCDKTNQDVFFESSRDNTKALSVEDERFLNIMEQGAHTNSTGNLEFPLPFKKEEISLPNNYSQAKSRLLNLLKMLNKKPQMMKDYTSFFEKILSRNHASRIPENELRTPTGRVWYLPHFAVRHPRKPGIRVVFDASAQYAGTSLNECLLQGPDQMNSLLGILLRFRLGEVAVMGDVEQMFHNFHVNAEHRDFLRFLWFDNNDPSEPITEFRMNVHLFGSISSPAVATFGLRMVADKCASSHGKDVKDFIHQDFYVDDGLTSQPDAPSAISLIQRSRDALATKKLRFHKIASNSAEVMSSIPRDERAKDMKSLDLDHDSLPMQRSLGVYWSLELDSFTFKVDLPDKPFSRRGVLSVASSIYDPIGLAAPVTIEGKVILRDLVSQTTKEPNKPRDLWDRPIPETFLPRWTRWRSSLHHLENVEVRRCYQPPDFGPVKRREIHIFSDASNLAIGAVAYLRLTDLHDQPYVSFLFAKAKVTPKHAVSIPRLELCAAVLATTLAQTVEPELRDRIPIDSTTYYTDSKVALGYISNESKRFHVYVANRVHKIHKMSSPSQWKHVSTNENPADIASRSVPATQLSKTIWFKGPDFLWHKEPISKEIVEVFPSGAPSLQSDDPEVRKDTRVSATDISDNGRESSRKANEPHLGCARFSRFSTWNSLKRAVATLMTKVDALKLKQARRSTDAEPEYNPENTSRKPTLHDLQRAEKLILRTLQRENFPDELHCLKSASKDNQKPPVCVKKKSPTYQLSPFLDDDGLIRVGGRLQRADIDLGGRHPILLPKDNHVSRLLIRHFHQEVQHQGRHTTFAAVRSGGYWVVGAHNLVRSAINQCTVCRKLRGRFTTQVMAELPKDRLDAAPPFTNVGMDVFGPWPVTIRKTRSGSSEAKRWAVLFTCMCTRAVHIEVVESLDTSAFISALRRFISLRGPVARLRCDRGTNFIGAEGELNRDKTAQFLATKNCEWVFNPPKASHFGGVWERHIRTIRRVLDSMFAQLGRHQLTHEILVTFMAEACAVVNSRPITSTSSDANDPQALTPAMLLTLKTQPLEAPGGDFIREDLYGRQRWRRVQYLADQFWIRWRKEYLQSLQPRRKWVQDVPNLHSGDVVLLRQREQPRNSWPLARVLKTHPSGDGKVRKVEVLTSIAGTRRTFLRPISELILIEKSPAVQT